MKDIIWTTITIMVYKECRSRNYLCAEWLRLEYCGLTAGPRQKSMPFEDICWGLGYIIWSVLYVLCLHFWSVKYILLCNYAVGSLRIRMEGRDDKRSTRRFASHHKHYEPSQDQVLVGHIQLQTYLRRKLWLHSYIFDCHKRLAR